MKKILLAVFLFLVVFFSKSQFSLADCVPGTLNIHAPNGGCGTTRNGCMVDTGYFCCSIQQECTDLRASVAGQPFGGYSSNSPLCGTESINTAIGCIPVGNTTEFMGWILGWALGIGGGISFLLIVYASFMIMTSAGAPERLKAGQELLTSAISGLIMLIFSVFILKFIGIDILGIDKL